LWNHVCVLAKMVSAVPIPLRLFEIGDDAENLAFREDGSEGGHTIFAVSDDVQCRLRSEWRLAAEGRIKIRRAERGIIIGLFVVAGDAAFVKDGIASVR